MKSFLYLMACLVGSFFFTGCLPEFPIETIESEQTAPVPALGAESGPCDNILGENYWFHLSVNQPGAPQNNQGMVVDMAYYSFLGAIPYYTLVDGCECKVSYYVMVFDFLPEANQIYLRDANGNPVPFSGPFSSSLGQSITIDKDDIYVGYSGGVNIGFHGEAETMPQLLQSGGYCIIENLSAPVEILELQRTEAYQFPVANPDNPQQLGLETYMPMSALAYQVQ